MSVDAVVKQRKRPIPSSCFLSQPNTGNGRVPRVVVKILSSNVIVNYVRSLDLIMYEINCYKICRNILVEVILVHKNTGLPLTW